MATLPTVAIIGAPNAGKSTLFNRLVGRRKAIVSDVPGTTRDQVSAIVRTGGIPYLLIDTGGIGGGGTDVDMETDVAQQSKLALSHADLILFTVDSRHEPTSSDLEAAMLLRKHKQRHVPVLLAITKCDDPSQIPMLLTQFYSLRIGDDVIAISAPHKIGIDTLQSAIENALTSLHFTTPAEPEKSAPQARIAVVGKPNVGKSSLVNALMSEPQRGRSPLLVSDIAGTTRDTTDTLIRWQGNEYIFMDTAGLRRHTQSSADDIAVYASFRSMRALELSDITILVLDASQPISKQDKRIASTAIMQGKGLIIALNKWDTIAPEHREQVKAHVRDALMFCTFAPLVPCSALTREGLVSLFPLIETVQRNRTRRIATKALHQWFQDAVSGQPMKSVVQSKYVTQAQDVPPTFVLFVQNPKNVAVSQLRYLENRLREVFAFEGTPIRWITKKRDAQ
ncbi:ribosome biogenesis GTPase Der [Candidatus Peribacteria bacterium]|nr:ribosome biogenesis GTPase Der [Candidatus Peribacteria bacterium]